MTGETVRPNDCIANATPTPPEHSTGDTMPTDGAYDEAELELVAPITNVAALVRSGFTFTAHTDGSTEIRDRQDGLVERRDQWRRLTYADRANHRRLCRPDGSTVQPREGTKETR